MNTSILYHLFLPHYLPSCTEDDFLLELDHQHEYTLLECMKKYLDTLQPNNGANKLPMLEMLTDCVKRWSILQNPRKFTKSNLQSSIEKLPPGNFLPLYFYAQNAAILIEIEDNNIDQPLVSSWQVLLPFEQMTSSFVPHFSCFPVTKYRLRNRSQLSSEVHYELLEDFMHNTIEYFKSSKGSQQFDNVRDVPKSHYICQWWIQQFEGVEVENNYNMGTKFKKKHRDHIRHSDARLPFRRSGLWMTIKVVFQIILSKHLGDVGIVVYKLLITHFLTYIIFNTYLTTSIDLLVHCIRKIVRRLNKIEHLLSSINTNGLDTWLNYTKQEIHKKINQILPKLHWQNNVQADEKKKHLKLETNFELHDSNIYQHLCQKLKVYLNYQTVNKTSQYFPDIYTNDYCIHVNQDDYIPSMREFLEKFSHTTGIALTRIEIWVESCLKQWINRPTTISQYERNRFEALLVLFEEYQNAALGYYWSEKGPRDPMGYTRFILTSLTIIRSMHQKLCDDPRFTRLKQHSINIPNLMNLFEFLVLPNRGDMIRARDLWKYFSEFHDNTYPDLLSNISHVDAFGVYYASQSSVMNENIQKIRDQAELDKQQKTQEVKKAKQNYECLMDEARYRDCRCYEIRYGYCKRCTLQQEANRITVEVYECPLPCEREESFAVIFELQMPIEIRSYRDILWQFVNRPNPVPESSMHEWLRAPHHDKILGLFNTDPDNCKVKLVSSTYTRYFHKSVVKSIGEFFCENSLNVQISPTKNIKFDDECSILTPQLDHPDYKQLQFSMETTQFMQNRAVAELSKCPERMKPTQFVEFGSFRSGHRLQWWNLLVVLEMDSLPIAEESVAILIMHSILQYGPVAVGRNIIDNSWCPEAHEQLLDDHFIDELISRLERRLDDCELNWQNELVLVIITMITMRMLTICNSSKQNKIVDLAIKCRRIGENWIDLISKSIQTVSCSAFNEIEKLRRKIVIVGISCILTFSIHSDRIDCLLSSNEHMLSLLKAATTIHDNIILNKNASNMSIFVRNIMRYSERILVMVQPTVAEFLQKTSYESLNDFAAIYWAVIRTKGAMKSKWKKRTLDSYDGWYDCQYGSRHISIDYIRGTFLVDNMAIGFLPEKITTDPLFVRVFDNYIFEVQSGESPQTYITKYAYHDDGKVHYEFYFNDINKSLIITERHIEANEIFQLIPHDCFLDELPDTFVSKHSHWMDMKNEKMEFRPIRFQETDFLNNKPYILSINTGYITTTVDNDKQTLVNQSTTLFQNLFSRYFTRLDDQPYIYMMGNDLYEADIIIHIHASRLGIAFEYNATTNIIKSREYSDMCIDEDQWLGTLTSLTSGLLLSPLPVNRQKLDHYPYKKLIVPFGKVHARENPDNGHQISTIYRSSSLSFSHQYFVFILNDRLKILQSTDSPTGWLYLALLHAVTSHPLPDHYTGMTGMERAFQLLNSAGCWSDQPFDSTSLDILGQIASVSPQVNYYPASRPYMEHIDWNSSGIPYSMQNFGYYLIAKKLIDTSQKLNFMYPSVKTGDIPELFNGEIYNEALLKKLYWDYRDSYNPSARLSIEMEDDILRITSTTAYYQTVHNCSLDTNYNFVCLVNDLYKDGDVDLRDCSKHHWLPLSQWLPDANKLKDTWIGLLKMAVSTKTEATKNNTDDIKRFETLLDFLHYIAKNCQIKPFYLQMLKTSLQMSTASLINLAFPPFISYQKIEEFMFLRERINLRNNLTLSKMNQILAEVEACWWGNREYTTSDELISYYEVDQINTLLKLWRSNKTLRSFLEAVQNQICSVQIEQFTTKVSLYPQQFEREQTKDHYQIRMKPTDKSIDTILLTKAEQKFHHFNLGYFNKPTKPSQITQRKNTFPQEIFPGVTNEDNSLREITDYFKNQLLESWNKFLSDNQNEKEDPTTEEIMTLLDSFRQESRTLWNELFNSIILSNEQLFEAGLLLRITPTTLIPLLQEKYSYLKNSLCLVLTKDQCTLLGGIIVNWTLEQQMERTLHFAIHGKWEDFKKEISHTPHSNWKPSKYISWLILELEMNITIREIQIRVAYHMIEPNMRANNSTVRNIVMQMNMGEGKTSVILPMLAVHLSSSNSSLSRIIVLKSLFPTNYQSLRYKLGGLINRRIFPFACRRDMNFKDQQVNQIFERFTHGLRNCDVILTSPEDILSFDLLTIDKCRRNEFAAGRSMLSIQRWSRKYVRDILDESDEILHVKYQLIYTVDGQQQVDGGAERWKTIEAILELVKKHAGDISQCFSEHIYYKSSERKGAFPQFRLQSQEPFPMFCEKIANDWIDSRNYCYKDKPTILSFILETNSSIENLAGKFPALDIQLFLIIRGLLSSEVLLVAFKKRYRVNYGVNPNLSCNRFMAVPFRAKDVVADRTEFGHPDIALVLTHLSYYYSGLSDVQLSECFKRLNEQETDPASIYDQWLLYEGENNVPQNIKQWNGVNLQDYHQLTVFLFPTFRHNMMVINYFLNHFVFPREAKQFPFKLVASAWDLSSSSRSKIITGFSGTNDTQLLLPVDIRQYDLPELQKTDAIVVNNLLQSENENYQPILINATSENILKQIVSYKDTINVILDVGALFIDGTNREIALEWLKQSDKNKIDYVVYFDTDSIVVCDRQRHDYPFVTSPASERLNRCVFYLDEIHTRGTDFKFPRGFKAALTLGNGLTKDRFVQACMRMRKLGNGHSLTFWSPHEVHQQIQILKKKSFITNKAEGDNCSVNLIDILRWVYENTQQSTWDGLHHWSSQSLNFQRKISAFQRIDWNDHQQKFTNIIMEDLSKECCEPEIIELISMYGASKKLQTLFDIHHNRYEHDHHHHHLSKEIKDAVLKRLTDYGGTKQRLSQLLDEEQQRELEQELEEERQLERPPPVEPCEPILHEEIMRLCDIRSNTMNLSKHSNVFCRLPYAFTDTTFFNDCQANSWQDTVWVSTEFQRVIATKGESLNPFLRPPRWMMIYRNQHLIFVSAFEANCLIGRLNALYHKGEFKTVSMTTLRLLLPRVKRIQSIFVNTPTLTVPPLIGLPANATTFFIPLDVLAQLFIFNGNLYFENVDEQTAYCQCLSLCPKLRTKEEEEAFQNGWIAVDGFVSSAEYCQLLKMNKVRFRCNLLKFVKEILENRNNSHAPVTSHVGSIIFNSFKLI
ncbi:unnamed protein product [Rotaria socialis]